MRITKFIIVAFIAAFSFNISARQNNGTADASTQARETETNEAISNLSEDKVLEIAHLVLATPIEGNEPVIQAADKIIISWLTKTDKLTLNITRGAAPVIEASNGYPYLMGAYLSAELINTVGNDLKTTDRNTFISSMRMVLTYYKNNRKTLPSVKVLDKWLKIAPDKLDENIGKQYDK